MGPFSISILPVGPDSLRVTYACGPFSIQLVGHDDTFLYLHPTCGTRRFGCHVYLWDHLTFETRRLMYNVYLWDLSPSPSNLWDPTVCVSCVPVGPSNLWDPMAYMSRVSVGPFSISIRRVGPDGLHVTCTIVPLGFNFLKKV